MKKIIAIFLTTIFFVMCFTGCTSNEKTDENTKKMHQETSDEKTYRKEALEKMKIYVNENLSKNGQVDIEENINNSTGFIYSDNNCVTYSFDVKNPTKEKEWVSASWFFFNDETLSGEKESDPKKKGMYHLTMAIRGGENEYQMYSYINPYNITVDSLPDYYYYSIDGNTTEEKPSEEIKNIFLDIFNLSLEVLDHRFNEDNYGIELKDIGFTNYVIDSERNSILGSDRYEKPEPAPISVEVLSFDHNSANAPELYAVFTNTGDATIEAFDFAVRCYDSYGEVIKAFGFGDEMFGARMPYALAPGESTDSSLHWTMNGFDDTRSVEIAIVKYKLEGCDTVEISPKDAVWN